MIYFIWLFMSPPLPGGCFYFDSCNICCEVDAEVPIYACTMMSCTEPEPAPLHGYYIDSGVIEL